MRPALALQQRRLVLAVAIEGRHRAPHEQLAARTVVLDDARDSGYRVMVPQRKRMGMLAPSLVERDRALRLAGVEHPARELGERAHEVACGALAGTHLDEIAIEHDDGDVDMRIELLDVRVELSDPSLPGLVTFSQVGSRTGRVNHSHLERLAATSTERCCVAGSRGRPV